MHLDVGQLSFVTKIRDLLEHNCIAQEFTSDDDVDDVDDDVGDDNPTTVHLDVGLLSIF